MKILTILSIILFSSLSIAQSPTSAKGGYIQKDYVSIGDMSPASASAALDVKSTTKGALLPRLTTTQRNSIGSPPTGLLLYNTTNGHLNSYDGSFWTDTVDTHYSLSNSKALIIDSTGYASTSQTSADALYYLRNATSDVQAQLNAKIPFNASLAINRAMFNDSAGYASSSVTTSTELSYVNGVTSPIQTQLDGKQATGNYLPYNASTTASRALFMDAANYASTGATTSTQLGYLSNVSQDLQLSLNQKISSSAYTTKGDLLSTDGTLTQRLGVGTNGYVLTASSAFTTGLTWSPASTGFTNPMTASGSLIYGGSSGTPLERLIGTNGYILTASGGLPVWASAPTSGFTNPMTTTGDIIYSSDNSGTASRLAIGNSTQVLTVSGGLPVWASNATSAVPSSYVRLYTGNGFGSTATKIRRFATTSVNQGTDITYTDSSTNGATFTLNTAGVYCFAYSDEGNTGAPTTCLSLNSANTTSDCSSLPDSEVLIITGIGTGNDRHAISWCGKFSAGDIIRPHTNTGTAGFISAGFGVRFGAVKIPQGNSPDPVSARYTGSLSGISGSTAIVKYKTKETDTDSSYDTSTGLYTAKQDGYYFVHGQIDVNATWTTGNATEIYIYKNGSAYNRTLNEGISGTLIDNVFQVTDVVKLAKGDTVGIYSDTSGSSPTITDSSVLTTLAISFIAPTGNGATSSIVATSTGNDTTSPSINTWYQPSALTVTLDAGTYRLKLMGVYEINETTNGATAGGYFQFGTSSTPGSGLIDRKVFGGAAYSDSGSTARGSQRWHQTYYLSEPITVTSTTTYYINVRFESFGGSPTSDSIGLRGDLATTVFEAIRLQ